MKTSIFIILISLFSIQLNGQCKKFIQKADFSSMKGYNCENTKVAEMYSGDEAVINQTILPEKRYKIKVIKAEHLGDYNLNIIDAKEEVVSIEVKTEYEHYWQISVDKETELEMYLTLDNKDTATNLQRSGCVALVVGSIDNSELAITLVEEVK